MLGPRADRDAATARRSPTRKGRRSYVTSAGSGPSVGKHLLMAYLPPDQAVVGNELAVEYFGEQYPGDRRGRRRDAAVRPGERADPELIGR